MTTPFDTLLAESETPAPALELARGRLERLLCNPPDPMRYPQLAYYLQAVQDHDQAITDAREEVAALERQALGPEGAK